MPQISLCSTLLYLAVVCSLVCTSKPKERVQMRGVNRSGAEYSCVQNLGIFEGPVDDLSVKNIKAWNVDVVRVALNEDCWLGINNHTAAYSGVNYQHAVVDYVNVLRNNGMKVILEMHWSDGVYDGSDYSATSLKPMPDAENAPTFWKSVALQFKNESDIIFDLFNEPFPDRAFTTNSTVAWECWRDGGDACPEAEFVVAGMQSLVDAVRSTGANNLIILGGLNYANDLSRWDEFKPNDSANNVVPSWHSYSLNSCNSPSCWEETIAPLAEKYDLIVGEIGENDCAHSYIDQLMSWLDARGISYLAWTWNTWNCSTGPALISDYDGTPTNYGIGYKNHLALTECK